MARRSRPAQGRNSTKRVASISGGGELIRRSTSGRNVSNTRPTGRVPSGSRGATNSSRGLRTAQTTRSKRSYGRALTRAVGAEILSDAEAAARVTPMATERRSLNTTANARKPTTAELNTYKSATPAQPYQSKVTGDISALEARLGRTATTDEIIQWAAHKWGIDEDVIRAMATQESQWYQSAVGDWVAGITNWTSYGISQVKGQLGQGANSGWPGTYPLSAQSTAFNLDYYGRSFRSFYDGLETWLNDGTNGPLNGKTYTAGDEYGCVGIWFAGHWYTASGNAYADEVYNYKTAKTWETFDGGDGAVTTILNDEDFENTTSSASAMGYSVAAGSTTIPAPNWRNTYPIFGSRSWTLINGSSGAWISKALPGGGYHETVYHSRVYFKAAAAPTNIMEIMAFRKGSTIAGWRLPAGALTPTLVANGVTVYTGAALTAGTSYRFDIKMHTSANGMGALEARIDGTVVYTSPTPAGLAIQSVPPDSVLLGQPSGAAGNNFSWDKWAITQNAASYPAA